MNRLAGIIMRTHGLFFRNRNTRRVHFEQAVHISRLVDQIYYEAAERETSVARALFMRLPDEAATAVVNHYFDPYYLRLTREGLWHWLENHVLFDKTGRIVVLHDYGTIIWKETNA